MKECREKVVRVGFTRNPRAVFDEIESVAAEMIRDGWHLQDYCLEEGMGFAHLFFERDLDLPGDVSSR